MNILNILKDKNLLIISILLIIGCSIIFYYYLQERKVECLEFVCNQFNLNMEQLSDYNIIASTFVISEKSANDNKYMDNFLNQIKQLYIKENTKDIEQDIKIRYEVKNYIPKWKLVCITILQRK